jgi:hypothetical protein
MELKMKKSIKYFTLTSCFIAASTFAHADNGSYQRNMPDQMFKDLDANSDGIITRSESKAFEAKKFQEMDANSDGQIIDSAIKY